MHIHQQNFTSTQLQVTQKINFVPSYNLKKLATKKRILNRFRFSLTVVGF